MEPQEDALDRQLREGMPYIDDDGFASRVIAQLPSARRESTRLRVTVITALTILGSVVAYFLSDRGHVVVQSMVELSSFPLWMILVFAFGSGALIGGLAVLYLLRRTPEFRDLIRLRS